MNYEEIRKNFFYYPPKADSKWLRNALLYKLVFLVGKHPDDALPRDWLSALIYAVRDLITEDWLMTKSMQKEQNQRTMYYLSMEFLMGRVLSNALIAVGMYEQADEALQSLGQNLAELIDDEVDPGLGNGGLGRLAACFLDSIATMKLPGIGYGIRYEYGMFSQEIKKGEQYEIPDTWQENSAPWEFKRFSAHHSIHYGGHSYYEGEHYVWEPMDEIIAIPYDYLIPGYQTNTVSTLRLWEAYSGSSFNLRGFNQGEYASAMAKRNTSENVSRVLYPNDTTREGRLLRLRQEYFLVSASLQDIIRKHKKQFNNLDNLVEQVAIHLNDTHPVLAIPEMMYILVDKEGYRWDKAWEMTQQIFSYTNHTLMGEALETWPVDMLAHILPRHLQIIFDINEQFLTMVREKITDDIDFIRRVSIVNENGGRKIRMAWLAVIGSHKVNGVAKLHSELMVDSIFADFARIYPERFTNVTNGVTPRRWICLANPPLTKVINSYIGLSWQKDLARLSKLNDLLDNEQLIDDLQTVKKANKARLFDYIEKNLGITVNPNALVDTQIKRIHEYKRQHLNIFHVIARYNAILQNPDKDWVPRVFVFAGKAASAYVAAKNIIHLINDVASVINNDSRVKDLLKVVFIPNYNVSLAQLIIPATDLSEQISLAGTEASGTSNMKFALNGALTIGTLDGANVEILERVGDENIFIFGHTVEEVEALRQQGYTPWEFYEKDPVLHQIIEQINNGFFSPDNPQRYHSAVHVMGDYYQAIADFSSYVDAQAKVDKAYQSADDWTRKTLINIANMGYFSSDRSIKDYAENIWKISPLQDDYTTSKD